MFGDWRANYRGGFLGDTSSWDGGCSTGTTTQPTVPWLSQAAGYRLDGTDRLLLDSHGQPVARLSPGAHPTTGPHDASSLAAPPVVTPALRALAREPAPLPSGLRPVTAAGLTGRWLPTGPARGDPNAYVELTLSGQWSSVDGCNETDGHFAVGPAGELLTTPGGGSTLIGCDNSPVGSWTLAVRRAGFDGTTLVYLDAAGDVIGRCQRPAGTAGSPFPAAVQR